MTAHPVPDYPAPDYSVTAHPLPAHPVRASLVRASLGRAHRHARRPGLRLLATLLVMLGLTIGLAGTASAHDTKISSDPADGSTLHVVPTSVTFTFDLPVQNYDPVVAVTGPGGKEYQTGSAHVDGNVVTSNMSLGPAGAYVAAYRIISADGHPVTGEVHFTLAAGATPGPTGSSATGSSAAGSDDGSTATAPESSSGPTSLTPGATATSAPANSGLSAWLWIGLVVAALIIAAAAVILLRRPTKD